MTIYLIKFRINETELERTLTKLGHVGPVVVEAVNETPTRESLREDIARFGRDMKRAAEAEPSNLDWKENTVDHSIPTTRRPYGLGKQTLLDRLKDGPVPFHALADTYENTGLKKSGLGSALGKLLVAGLIERGEPGFWKLKGN